MLTYIVSQDTSTEIVSLQEAQEHSRITDSYDELVVQECLDSAHDLVQQWLNRKLYPTVAIHQRDEWRNEITLPFAPICQILAVTADFTDEVEYVLEEGVDWKWDHVTGSIKFYRAFTYIASQYTNYRIQYNCGYGTPQDVPAAVKHAILMTFATLYENREDTVIGTQVNTVPLTAQRVLKSHRLRSFM